MRYALYFTPAQDDPLTVAAARWLGRDAFSGGLVAQGEEAPLSLETLREATAEPRRYGFHATLKAPFALADGASPAGLIDAMAAFAAETRIFDIPALSLGRIGAFFALVPGAPCPPLREFAADCVRRFEPFRAPLAEADIARRRPERLTPAQREHLAVWGYPYVMDEFRFHMTLSGPLEPALADAVEPVLKSRFAGFLGKPLPVSGLALFVEPERGAPFTVHTWLPLAA
ncbi:DUF1045 domain-containing protein [Rhizobiaceae bacterium BDR2-2]|uniref:DUF1045 domain-containing protein n=1 Tax=Ectorhizobium quercum TaxID=2965071 RepID=A0AAE3MXT6_9HYPH|nr:DUF1045 domain-containing protein [Ectorhizobium quercum]MCX8995640.1 DUF1045 domain-containing protein [Ectorhizobium quercum]